MVSNRSPAGDAVLEGARALAEMIRSAQHLVALTGAGASTESGLPDYRSKDGLWRQRDPSRVASITALRREPVSFYQFYAWRLERFSQARPNPVHRALAALEKAGYLKLLVTQNVDGLHQQAGSQRVVEVHGSLRQARCSECGRIYDSSVLRVPVNSEADMPRCECSGLLRPNVVLFGEALPELELQTAIDEASICDVMLVVGTSLQVGPVNMLPEIALANGAKVAIINRDPTPLDGEAHLVLPYTAGTVLSETCRLLHLEV